MGNKIIKNVTIRITMCSLIIHLIDADGLQNAAMQPWKVPLTHTCCQETTTSTYIGLEEHDMETKSELLHHNAIL